MPPDSWHEGDPSNTPKSAPEPYTGIVSQHALEGLIHLDVAARDEDGKPIAGLTANDFALLDNGSAQKIKSFYTSGSDPSDGIAKDEERLTEVIFVLDEVNLSEGQFDTAKKETIRYLQQNGGKLTNPVSVYWFSISGLFDFGEPTTDGNALANKIEHRHFSNYVWGNFVRSTQRLIPVSAWERMWDNSLRALYTIVLKRRNTPGRKALVWIGFGWPDGTAGDSDSQDTAFWGLVELSSRIREARVAIYQVAAWDNPEHRTFDYREYVSGVRSVSDISTQDVKTIVPHFALPVLAFQSGGLVMSPSTHISEEIGQCVQDASSFYSISFDPPHADHPDEYHDLKIQIDKPQIKARTNTGYYDQPVLYDQPRVPVKRVSVHELEEILSADASQPQDELVATLNGLELTELLSSQRLTLWRNRLSGDKSKEALTALADTSAFLDPPADEVLSDPAPAQAELIAILKKTVQYLNDTLPRLPDLSAKRIMVEYKQRDLGPNESWHTAPADQSLYKDATITATLVYRNGHEVHDAEKKKISRSAKGRSLDFVGVFGPILNLVLGDATRNNGKLTWSRWEQGERGRMGVISYSVTAANSAYEVNHCCLRRNLYFKSRPAYHGELAVDPTSGAVLRLTMQAEPGWILEPDLHPVLPVMASEMMVEYGPVMLGGHESICPVRSVVLARTRGAKPLIFWGERFEVYSPYETQLNDIAYTDYRKFGSEMRILPGFEVVPSTTPDGAGKPQTPVTKQPNP